MSKLFTNHVYIVLCYFFVKYNAIFLNFQYYLFSHEIVCLIHIKSILILFNYFSYKLWLYLAYQYHFMISTKTIIIYFGNTNTVKAFVVTPPKMTKNSIIFRGGLQQRL